LGEYKGSTVLKEHLPIEGSASPEEGLQLVSPPATETGAVKAWDEPVTLLTYTPAQPDIHPLFLESRVYQGSSGRVYPLPVIDAIETTPRPRVWQAIHLENEFLRLMVLPEIGGRIHVGLDKRTGYDFFYRQNVIKPALVGLAGPWISGGVEFNWPQHHRPATYMPVECAIEREHDGAVTVWCSDHDPMARMKGMHGLRLRPGRAILEVRVRLYNRTQDTQTFLWWANMATRVHERYQSFFPHDVRFAADHAKRAITEYPLSQRKYYGVDYGERARTGVPAAEMPHQFVPDSSYPPNDLGWYANIPVPTSYMMVGSRGDFFGGYDHRAQAGTVAVANHHISPGKKQWTWGNHEFGYAWDRSLTDADGPYVELMSGVYTDNQPDFSFLAPGETKTFSQFWYPISEIGVPDLANVDAAMRVEETGTGVCVHVQSTSDLPGCTLIVRLASREIGRFTTDLRADTPLHHNFSITGDPSAIEVVLEQSGKERLRYALSEIVPVTKPEVATEPPLPQDVESADELYLTGLHLEQYRHPTRHPELYWIEAIRRDTGDSRANAALGRFYLRRGEFQRAELYLRTAIVRMTRRNPNPYDGEPHYNLGLALHAQSRTEEAYEAFYKSTWNAAWRGPAYHRLAEIDCTHDDWELALDHLDRSLRADTDNLNARNLKSVVLNKLGHTQQAEELLQATRHLDPLDIFSRFLETGMPPHDGQRCLDLAFDLVRASLLEEALTALQALPAPRNDGTTALLLYLRADTLEQLQRHEASLQAYRHAAKASADFVFPSRLEELQMLERAIERNPSDARAPYYLGNLLYDRRRYEEAIALWQRATRLDPDLPTCWRNLGFAYFNVRHDVDAALAAFTRARALAPHNARLLYEQDQLRKRMGEAPEHRLVTLQKEATLVALRDDLSIELATLYNSTGKPSQALEVLLSRQFGPWEGGEGLVLGQYVRANVLLAREALKMGDAAEAMARLHSASNPPASLSEAMHPLANRSMIDYWLGRAHAAVGDSTAAAAHWERAARQRSDFQQMHVQPVSEMTYWSALALKEMGHKKEATTLFERIAAYGRELEQQEPKVDYFATSLPTMLLFEEDTVLRHKVVGRFLQAQAMFGFGARQEASTLLHEVLKLDRNYAPALDLAAESTD
jgi:tetratricopeptide (TPR) repeat protein